MMTFLADETSVPTIESPLVSTAAKDDRAPFARLSTFAFTTFSVGMIGDRIFRDAPALLLLLFMTDYLAIPPALAGTAIFIPKLLIMFIDPMVGTLSDRIRTRWGRRRPLMFIGAILAGSSIVLFFHVPRFGSPLAQAVYMSAIILIGFTGYSLYSVPYLTMASEIANDDNERRRIMSWRVAFMATGLSISAFAGAFIEAIGGGIQGYETMSWVYGGVCLLTMLATVFATGSVPAPESDGKHMSVVAQFKLVGSNRRYLSVLLVGFTQKLCEGVGFGSFAYFCIYVVKQSLGGIGLVVLASMAGQVLTQPIWLWASKRWTPPTVYTVGILGGCLNLILWLLMKGHSQIWLIPLGLQAGASAGGYLMVTLAMLSNTLAADAAETGINREGVYSGFWLASEKLAFALGALIVGVIINLFGFVESSNGVRVTQTSMAILGVAFAYVGVEMILYFISILAVRRLDRKTP
jgi:GPH family glycoside/pentoside/hexuronide:cation symporter